MNKDEKYLRGLVPDALGMKFRRARWRIRRLSFVKGFLLFTGFLLVAFILAALLDRAFRLASPYRFAVLTAVVGGALFVIIWYIAMPLLRSYTSRRIAISVEAINPILADSLLTTVELAEEYANGTLMTSPELVKAHALKTYETTQSIDFRSIAPYRAVASVLIFALLTAAVVCGFYFAETPIAENVLARMLQPFNGPEPFTYTRIDVQPGSTYLQKGDNIHISAALTGRVPEYGYLYWRANSNSWERIKLEQQEGELMHEFGSVLTPIQYKFRAGDARSDTYTITPVTSPAVIAITPKVFFPEYTRTQPKNLRESGGLVSVVSGSKVVINALTNKPCRKAILVWIDGKRLPMQVSGTSLESSELDIEGDGTYWFELTDELGFSNIKPIYYRVEVLKDESPTIVIDKPSQYSEVAADSLLPVVYSVLDDFGVEALWIEYNINKRPEAEEVDILPEHIIEGSVDIDFEERGSNSLRGEYGFVLSELSLMSGDVITFRLKARDGDILTGPNTGESEKHKVKIISDEENLGKIEREQRDIQRRIEWLINRQKDVEDTVEELTTTLLDEEKLSKDDENTLTSARQDQDEIERTDREIVDDIEKVIDKMQQNPIIGLRSVIQFNEIKKALEVLADREMTWATDELRSAEKAGDPTQRGDNLDRTSQLQDEIIKRLEEIDEQLNRAFDEQQIAGLANAARKLAKKQDETIQETAAARKELSGMVPEEMSGKHKRRLKKLVEEEKKLAEQLDQLEQRMYRTSKQMKYGESGENESIDQAIKQLDDDKTSDDMKEAEEHLRSNHLNKAMQAQKSASKKLWDLVRTLEKQDQKQFSNEFRNLQARMQAQVSEIDRIIELQQGIIDETVILPVGDEADPLKERHLTKFMELSASQTDLHKRTEELAQDLQKLFKDLVLFDIDPVSPLNQAIISMGGASQNLVQLRQPDSLKSEKEAIEQLEKARIELAKAVSKLLQEAQLQQMMEQMSVIDEMIEKQLKINEDTKDIDGRIKPEQTIPDTLQRLTMKLSRLQKELADTSKLFEEQLEQMKEIAELMEEISKRLNELKTGKDTQSMQEDVVEKLLSTLMQLQMQMAGMAQNMGMSVIGGSSGSGNRSRIQLPPRFKEKPEGISDDQWSKLPEDLKKQLLDAWSEGYPPKFRRLLNVYYRRLSSEEDR